MRLNYKRVFGKQEWHYREVVFREWTLGELTLAHNLMTHRIDPKPVGFISAVVPGSRLDVSCAAIVYFEGWTPLIKRVRGERDRYIVNATKDMIAVKPSQAIAHVPMEQLMHLARELMQ